jgi:Mg-chelatase subunit ChlD
MIVMRLICVGFALIACGCALSNPGEISPGDEDATVVGDAADGAADAGDEGAPNGDPFSGVDICNEEAVSAEGIPPNLLLVVDRSLSMNDRASAGSMTSKLQDAKAALNAMLDNGAGRIRFGWMHFPQEDHCEAGEVQVECGLDSLDAIRLEIEELQASGSTPTAQALSVADTYWDLYDQERDNFVILLTDGEPECGEGAPAPTPDEQALDAIRSLAIHDIGTYVIGLGEINNTNPELLNQMAEAGGHPRPGAVKYHQANSLEELNAALDAVSMQTVACILALHQRPDIPDWLWVYFDDVALDKDPSHQDGWDYDLQLNQIEFYGPACDRLRSGQVTRVDVRMGCGPVR